MSMRPDFFHGLFGEMTEAFRSAPEPEAVDIGAGTVSALAKAEAVAVVFGWTNRVVRTGEASLILLDAGFEAEAAPLIRSMIEHAIALHWLVDTPAEALQALIRERQHQVAVLREAQASGWELSEETQRLIEEALAVETDRGSRSADRLLATRHRAIAYGLGFLYQAWLVETWDSHASRASATAYYDATATDQIPLYFEPRHTGHDRGRSVLIATMVALAAYAQVLPDEWLTDRLSDWDGRLRSYLEGEQT